jgi:CRP-like cAMP-binding protein
MKTLMKERDDLKRAMEVLQSVPLFSELTSTQLERLANSLRRREVKTCPDGKFAADDENFPEGVVIHQGDVGSGAQAMYVVESGHLQACVDVVRSVSNPDGVVKEYTAGDFFGELAIVTDQPRSATVRCVETTVLLELERKDVLELLPGQLSNLISAHRRQTAMQVLKKVPMFSDLSQTKIEELAHNLHRKEIHTDENGNFSSTDPEFPNGVVIRQGELGDTMFVVESGYAPTSLLLPH